MDVIDWILVAAVIVVVLGIFAFYFTHKMKKSLEDAIDSAADFDPTQKIIGTDGMSGVGIDEKRRSVCLVKQDMGSDGVASRVLSFKDILSCELFEDGEVVTKTVRSSQAAGAIIGGLALGGVGAIIGGLSGKTRTEGKVKSVDLRIVVNDTGNPLHDVKLLDMEAPKSGIVHRSAMDQGRHWHGLFSVLIKQADKEGVTGASPVDSLPGNQSTADELAKLVKLKNEGVLTNEEFASEKRRLLSS